MMSFRSLLRRVSFVLAIPLILQACGGGSTTTGPGNGSGSIAISLASSSASIAQGGTTSVLATLTRNGGFTGAVTFNVTGAPSGVTAGIPSSSTSGTTTTGNVVVSAAADSPAGTYTLTITASGSGVTSVSATFTLTITAVTSPNYSISLSPASASVVQGATTNTTATLTRTGGFAGSVNLSLTNAPSGVTATFTPNNTTGNTSAVVISVGAAVAPGVYTVYVGGVASGQADKVTPFVLTVTAAGSYTLGVPGTASVVQGANVTPTITVTRNNGFSTAVALTATGMPTGMTASFNPQSVTGTSSVLTIATTGSVTPGSYPVVVHANAAGTTEQTGTINVTVTASGGGGGGNGNVQVSFASCAVADKPLWFAAQNGTGAWTVVTPTNDVYSFTVNAGKGGYAFVRSTGGTFSTSVQFYTQTEMTAQVLNGCGASAGTTKTNSLPVTGLGLGETGSFYLGGASASATVAGTIALSGVASGPQDLFGWRTGFDLANPLTPPLNRVFIRRDVNSADGVTLATADFNGAESYAPQTATLTATNATGTLFRTLLLATGASCTVSAIPGAGLSTTLYGLPVAQTRSTDYYTVTALDNGVSSSRAVMETFKTFGNRTVTFGPALASTTTSLGGAYKRLQSVFTVPSEYQTSATFQYSISSSGAKAVVVSASYGWFGGTTATLAMPDFSALSGWNNSWVPTSGDAVTWYASAFGFNGTFGNCIDGSRSVYATQIGSN